MLKVDDGLLGRVEVDEQVGNWRGVEETTKAMCR